MDRIRRLQRLEEKLLEGSNAIAEFLEGIDCGERDFELLDIALNILYGSKAWVMKIELEWPHYLDWLEETHGGTFYDEDLNGAKKNAEGFLRKGQ